MPVTTQLQARLSTCSTEELSTEVLTGTRVLLTSSMTDTRVLSKFNTTHQNSSFNSSTLASPLISSTIDNNYSTLVHSPVHNRNSSEPSCHSFQNLEFQNADDLQQISNYSSVFSELVPSIIFNN